MKSLINIKNISNVPYSYLVFLLFLYVCPNIKYFGIGEMSYLPVLIILSAYSLLTKLEFLKYLIFLFIVSIWPFYALTSRELLDFSIISPLVSFYIIVIPILTSILLGRIIGLRFSGNSKDKNSKEFKRTIIFLITFIFLSGVINKIAPSLLQLIIHSNRTSFARWTFFFTEPSQSASVLLMFWFASFHIFFKQSFSGLLGKNKKLFFIIIPSTTILFSYLSLPTTLIAQVIMFFGLNFFIFFVANFIKIIFSQKIKIKKIFKWITKKRSLYSIFLLLSSMYLSYVFLFLRNNKLIFALRNFIYDAGSLLDSIFALFYIGGFRFYYSFAAIISSFENPLNLPGSWYGRFVPKLLDIVNRYDLNVSDKFLQLERLFAINLLKIKPLGWFYFSVFDLGIIGFCIFCLIFLYPFFNYFVRGILSINLIAISLFSAQIALLTIPILPSTPSVFFPILIYSALCSYEKKLNSNLNN